MTRAETLRSAVQTARDLWMRAESSLAGLAQSITVEHRRGAPISTALLDALANASDRQISTQKDLIRSQEELIAEMDANSRGRVG